VDQADASGHVLSARHARRAQRAGGTGNPYTYVPLLKRIGINVDAIEPEADPNLLAAQGKTQGPDGRIEVQKSWRFHD
jgi:hypothetical protein